METEAHILNLTFALNLTLEGGWRVQNFHFGLRNHLGGRLGEVGGGQIFDFYFDFLVLGRLCEVLGEARKWLSDPTKAPIHILEPHICLEFDFRRWLGGSKIFSFWVEKPLRGSAGRGRGGQILIFILIF